MRRLTQRPLRVAAVAGVAGLLALTAACGGSSSKPAAYAPVPAPKVDLAVATTAPSTPVKIGVVATSTHGAEGGDVLAQAEGAVVAAYRLGSAVQLVVENDHGTSAGATAAVAALLRQGVTGIVDASTGPHITAGLVAASKAGVPTLVPYDDGTDVPAGLAHVWETGPTVASQAQALQQELTALHAQHVVVLASGQPPAAIGVLGTAKRYTPGSLTSLATQLKGSDAVVVWGDAEVSAEAAAQVEQAAPSAPILLSDTALSPAFGTQLAAVGAQDGSSTLAGNLYAAGEPVSDLLPDQGVSDFLVGLRAATTAGVAGLDGTPLAHDGGAAGADTAAYDAVIVLARAGVAGGDPTKTTSADGLAGPELDFTTHDALPPSGTAVLHATTQSSGLRPQQSADAAPTLSWYPIK